MKKHIIILFSLLTVLSLTLFPTNAAEEKGHVFDNANYLTEAEEEQLEDLLAKASESGVYYLVYTSTRYIEQDRYDALIKKLGFSVNDDLALFAIYPPQLSGAAYGYNLAVYGVADKRLSYDEYNTILDHKDIMDNIYAGDLLEGLSAFPSLTQYHIEHGKGKDGYREPGFSIGFNQILLTFGAMLVTFLIFFFSVRSSYRKKNKGGQYPLDQYSTTEITNRRERYSHRRISVITIARNPGGGGHGGAHGGHGGARSGGR